MRLLAVLALALAGCVPLAPPYAPPYEAPPIVDPGVEPWTDRIVDPGPIADDRDAIPHTRVRLLRDPEGAPIPRTLEAIEALLGRSGDEVHTEGAEPGRSTYSFGPALDEDGLRRRLEIRLADGLYLSHALL